MKKAFPFFLLIFSCVLLITGCSTTRGIRDLRDTPIGFVDYHAPKPEIWTLPNGLSVYYVQDDELPLVGGELYMPGGSLWEPSEMNGIAAAMGSQLRLGGAGRYSPAQLDLVLEKLAASIGSSVGQEFGKVSFHCLEQDLETVFGLFADVVLRPQFDVSRLQLWKTTALENIRRRKDEPEEIASSSLIQLLYEGTPYGTAIESKDVEKVSRLDLLRMHRKFIRPNDAILVVSGSAPRETIESLVKRHFSQWEARKDELGPPPLVTTKPKPAIYFVQKPFSQSSIYIGQLSVPRHTPDQYAISVFNNVLGTGGFDSRLMKQVRTKHGYVYGIYGSTNAGLVRGTNVIGMQTKAQSTVDALKESLRIVGELQQAPATEDEVALVKQAIQSSFVFRFDSPSKSAVRQALLKLYKYPKDYDERYLERIFAVDGEQVQQVAEDRWRMDDFVIVVVGNETAYNLLKTALESPPQELAGYSIIDGTFYEKFVRS
ncbi:MAG: insulinase family protein [Bdellovibrionales bacterium]|nr:insulinase family protein [Bdellovibrionales bacterium]